MPPGGREGKEEMQPHFGAASGVLSNTRSTDSSLVGAILWGPPKELFMGTDRGSFLKSYQVDSVLTSEWSSKKVELHRFWKRKLTAAKISNESKRFNNVMLINFTQSLPRNKWFFFRAQGSLSVIEIDTTKQKERYFLKKIWSFVYIKQILIIKVCVVTLLSTTTAVIRQQYVRTQPWKSDQSYVVTEPNDEEDLADPMPNDNTLTLTNTLYIVR